MTGIYILLILSSALAVGTALKCYSCQSTFSWDDCKAKSIKGYCLESFVTKCSKIEVTVTDKSTGRTTHAYAKGCAKTCNPNDLDECKLGHWTCTIHCCSGDYCNAGSSLVASIIIPAICALISVVFTKMH